MNEKCGRTTFKLTSSPAAFLTLRSLRRKYQKRDLATTSLGAKMRIRYSLGSGSCSDGSLRPTTWYSRRAPIFFRNKSDVFSELYARNRRRTIVAGGWTNGQETIRTTRTTPGRNSPLKIPKSLGCTEVYVVHLDTSQALKISRERLCGHFNRHQAGMSSSLVLSFGLVLL